jgi:EAL domain-containing protein (putative c-di-GMP-specific phosphodiesterase class I)
MDKDLARKDSQQSARDLVADLGVALSDGQFFLVYQPTIDLQTGAFAGVEALIRWRHPQRGVLGPDAFIRDLEASGEIAAVGRWALQTACAQGAIWHDKGYRFAVSVNVSALQFARSGFADDVAQALVESRFDPALLVLEFNQPTLLADRAASRERLAALKALGVRLAVDDFEPGTSSLEELEEFNLDVVKLDRAFVAEMAASGDAASQVHALVQSGESRHLQVIASGVEDADQRERLAHERVHAGQGYLFSAPHEAGEIDHFLEDFAIFSGKPL